MALFRGRELEVAYEEVFRNAERFAHEVVGEEVHVAGSGDARRVGEARFSRDCEGAEFVEVVRDDSDRIVRGIEVLGTERDVLRGVQRSGFDTQPISGDSTRNEVIGHHVRFSDIKLISRNYNLLSSETLD